MAEDDKNFVSRWSRLKRTRAEEGLPDPAVTVETPIAEASNEPEAAGEADVEELVKSLPDIETMTEESDFTVFLQKGVPQELKQRALRRLWRLNPVFANLDGLNDYDEDFTTSALVGKAVKTLYEVGKGMPGPKKLEKDEAETASELDQEAGPDGEEAEDPEAEDGESPEQEPKGEIESAEALEGVTAAEGEQENAKAAAPASELRGPLAEPAPSAVPNRGRAVQRRWGNMAEKRRFGRL